MVASCLIGSVQEDIIMLFEVWSFIYGGYVLKQLENGVRVWNILGQGYERF